MDEQQLTDGLRLLADEARPHPLDVDRVVERARARGRGRVATIAAGVVTTALVGSLVLALNGFESAGGPPAGQLGVAVPGRDARSARLDTEFAATRSALAEAGLVTDDSFAAAAPFHRWYDSVTGTSYVMRTILRDGTGMATLEISVGKVATDKPFTAFTGPSAGTLEPCTSDQPGCVRRTLPDGTIAAAWPNSRPVEGWGPSSVLCAQRPNGTYIVVVANVGAEYLDPPRPVPPLDAAQLLEFATAFTY
ncbi:hypothetical protein GCM10022243_10480 [Saccharothrix violaceirubra]|uniref:Uncharacterized protein n=1 Tax=Saccharothrix violaceirubra TaxID=413306 RepID=A0A7W7T3Y7_9PSEU|nr:hypothetical protein [Saccharothrix violaceirubra]MBB4966112.1 hypothetical protein [Saccharothrix violaceirubra]